MNVFINNRMETDSILGRLRNTERRVQHELNGKSNSSSTRINLGIDIELHIEKWIEFQMTPDMNWSSIEIDHVEPTC